MASPSVKKMGVAGGIQEGNYASSKVVSTRGMTNRELGLTLLPGSQISSGLPDSPAQVTQVAFRDRHSGSHSEQALDSKSLICRPHASENDCPATSTSTPEAGESVGADIQDVDLSSFQIPSIGNFSLDWCFEELGMPTLHDSSNAVAPADFDMELFSGGFCAEGGSQQSHCLIEQSLESQQPGIEASNTSDIERCAKSDITLPSGALAMGSTTISSDNHFIRGNFDSNPEPLVQNSSATNNGLEFQLHQLEQKINELTKSLQLTNKELEDERAEKQKLKKKAKSLAKLLRECAPGKVSLARVLKDVGKIPVDDEDNTRISYDPLHSPNPASQFSPAPVEAQAKKMTVPSSAPIDLTTDDGPLFVTQISPSSSVPLPSTPSSREHGLGPLAILYNRLEKRPFDWLEGSHPLTGAKRQKSLDFINENIQALEVVNEACQAANDARILSRKEEAQARQLKSHLEKKAEMEAKKSAEARGKKTRKGQNGSEDLSVEMAEQMTKPTQGQVQDMETTLGRQDRTTHARSLPDIDTLSNSKYNSPQPPPKYPSNDDEDEDFDGLGAELEKAMEAEFKQGGEVHDGLEAELESAMTAEEARKNDDDRLSADSEAVMPDEPKAKGEGLGAELDATKMAARKGFKNGDDGPNTEEYESSEESEEE